MQVAPSASTYAPAPGDLASPPAPGSAFNSYTDQPQDNASAFTDSGPGGYAQPDPQSPQADPTLASTSLFAPTDQTPSTTLALMVQAQTKPLLVTPENAAGLRIDLVSTKPLTVTPENAAGLGIDLAHTKPLQITPENPATGTADAQAAAPNASPTEIAALELLLAEPANQEIVAQFGPPLRPLNTDTDVGQGILARFGPDLGARLTQLQEAHNAVRDQFLQALDHAQQDPGPEVAGSELMARRYSGGDAENVTEQTLYSVTHPPSANQASDLQAIETQALAAGGQHQTLWRLSDPAEFAKAYASGDSPAQRAFAQLHGKEPLQWHAAVQHGETDAGPDITPAYYGLGESQLVLGGPTVTENGNPGPWAASTWQTTQLTPEQNRDLINNEYLWFDPVNGWSTDLANNIRQSTSFLDKALPMVFAGVMTFATAGAFGITAASASTSLGQSMALGAISSATMQLTTGGKIDLGDLLRSALIAGVSFGVMNATGMNELLQGGDLATRSLGHLGKAGLQGVLQEATGGKFKDGLTNSLLASVAGEVGKSLEVQIAELSKNEGLSVQEASMLRLIGRAASSAVKVAGSNDPAAGFASDFLGGVLGEELRGAQGKGQSQSQNPSQAGNEGQPGDRPSSDWVRNLGASEVDAQGLGLRPGLGGLGVRVSDEVLSGWSDEIDGGIALNGSMAPEAQAITEAVVGKGQGPLAALEAAGLDKQQQIAAYGQLLASGQIQLNAQGVPIVQPGQVLQFDLSDTGAAQLGGRAIAQESAGRAQREALAQQAREARQQGMSPEQAADIYTQYGGRSSSYAGLTPTWSGRMVDVPGGGVDALGNPTGMPEQVWVSDKPSSSWSSVGNAIQTGAMLIDGAVQLGVNGVVNGMWARPASGLAALPALVINGTEAYTAIQADLQERMSLQSNNPGAIAIQQSLGQMLQPVGQTLDQLRTASENRFGDGWTTAGFTAAQAALEVGGFLGGVAAIPGGRAALFGLGDSIQGGLNTLVDAMPVGSGDAARWRLTSQVGAVGDLEGTSARVSNSENALPEGLAYRTDLPEHLTGPDGFTKSGQLSGTHNLYNATAALDAKGATYTLKQTGTEGILELSYSYTKPTSGKIIAGSKTVYDPSKFSNQTLLNYSLSAGQKGWTQYLANPNFTSVDVTHGGINFRVYINVDEYGNRYVGNVHPIN